MSTQTNKSIKLGVLAAGLLGVLGLTFTGDNSFAAAQAAHRAHTTGKKHTVSTIKPRHYDGVPLKRAKDKQQIIAYYRNVALSPVRTHDFRLDDTSIFCLSFDSGSGAYIEWGYVYIREGEKWLLAYQQVPPFHPLPNRSLLGIDFRQKGSSELQVIGAYQITYSASYASGNVSAKTPCEYKVLKTIGAATLLKK